VKTREKRPGFDAAGWARKAGEAGTAEGAAKILRTRTTVTLDELAARLHCSRGHALDLIDAARATGLNVVMRGDVAHVAKTPAPMQADPERHHLRSDAAGRYRVGIISDTHIGSTHARLDVMAELYDWFAAEGIREVYHAGNWIDGEARFNVHELLPEAHGMQAQLDLFVATYPQRKGVRTLYVTGDDHEGWYAQREGVDIGRMLEDTAHRAGRHDLVNLGYKEAFITLEHRKSGETSKMLIDHPGGGSAYADSYAAQKRVEAAQPGEKPGLWVFGHWHKMGYFRPRGVHVLLAGCTKDLDTFGRKKGLRYDVGGIIADITQDAAGGLSCITPQIRQFFDRGYYNMQFDLARVPAKVRAPHGRRAA